MPTVNHGSRVITCKLVYCGPGRAGKATNLTYLHGALPTDQVGELTSVATRRDRTLFLDYTPQEHLAGAYTVQFQLCTVPGVPFYQGTRKVVLQGVDGIVFVADSQRKCWEQNLESLQDLHNHLADLGLSPNALPFVFQYNKRDLGDNAVVSVADLSAALNFRGAPQFLASAAAGDGVIDTLRSLTIQVLRRLGVGREESDAARCDGAGEDVSLFTKRAA